MLTVWKLDRLGRNTQHVLAVVDELTSRGIGFRSLTGKRTYASLCVAAGIKPAKLSGRMGHANVRTTLDVYGRLFPDDDATEDMAALGALAAPKSDGGNVVALRR